MTSGTVFVAVLALVLFGGPVLYSFSVAMLWGVIVGTYSSIWVACAGLVYLKLRPEQLSDRRGEGREGQGVIAAAGRVGPADKTLPTPDPAQVQLIRSYGPGHFLISEREWRSPVLVTPTRTTAWNVGPRRRPRPRQSRGPQGGADADRASGRGLRAARGVPAAGAARVFEIGRPVARGGRYRLGLPHLQRAAGRRPARGGGADSDLERGLALRSTGRAQSKRKPRRERRGFLQAGPRRATCGSGCRRPRRWRPGRPGLVRRDP